MRIRPLQTVIYYFDSSLIERLNDFFQSNKSRPKMEFEQVAISNTHKLRKLLFGSYEGLPFSHRTSRSNHGAPIPPLRVVNLDRSQ